MARLDLPDFLGPCSKILLDRSDFLGSNMHGTERTVESIPDAKDCAGGETSEDSLSPRRCKSDDPIGVARSRSMVGKVCPLYSAGRRCKVSGDWRV